MLDDARDIRHQHKKLRIFSSPLVHRADKRGDGVRTARTWGSNYDGANESDDEERDHGDELPRFERVSAIFSERNCLLRSTNSDGLKYEEPTLLEIFYDLFFAANYNVFSDTQQVTGHSKFKASVGYFWFVQLSSEFHSVDQSSWAILTD